MRGGLGGGGSFATNAAQADKALADEQKTRESDIVTRALYGGNSEKDLQGALASSTTGYSDPGVAKFAKNPILPDTYQKMALQKARPFSPRGGGANSGDQTDHLVKFLATYDTAKKVPTGGTLPATKATGFVPLKETRSVKPDDAVNVATIKSMFKTANFNDPRVVKALKDRFPEPPAEVPPATPPSSPAVAPPKVGFMDQMKSLFSRTAPDSSAPGSSRVYTDGGALPKSDGVQEGSFLKSNGVRTHVLRGGQWQPIN